MRALQICIVFVTTLTLQRALEFSHAGWIGFAVMMIYAGFDAGSSIQRTIHRFLGALFGLFLSYVLWIMGQIDYRSFLIIVPIVVFFAFFSLGKSYAFPTVFTVTLTALGTYYYPPADYETYNFFFDYFRATLIAFFICMVFEGIVFKNKNLTHRFHYDLRQHIIQHLRELLDIVSTKPIQQSQYIKLSAQCNLKVMELQQLIETTKYDYHVQHTKVEALKAFDAMIEKIYLNIYHLFVEQCQTLQPLIQETTDYLEKLTQMNKRTI
jgi:uncharacterized membrane protein YccC